MKYSFQSVGIPEDEKLQAYIRFKMHELGRHIPRKLRSAATIDVRLAHKQYKDSASSRCTVELLVGDSTFRVVESTIHPYAALDIVCVELAGQLKRYKRSLKK